VCADIAPGADAAAALAVACDREVEVLAARSEWASTFALPDGSMRLDTSVAAVRTDVSGEWEPVDASVVEGDGGLVVASAVTPMTFSDGSDGAPLARQAIYHGGDQPCVERDAVRGEAERGAASGEAGRECAGEGGRAASRQG